jgi:DNA-binding CsgD family transcriptional regulator/tetratricopeptide (TPR) repeat protein
VGRDGELSEIAQARGRAAAGLPQIVIVRGEAGIGKSRLVEEAIGRARAEGEAILHGACIDFGGEGVPYLPIIAALRGLSRTVPPDALGALLGPHGRDLAPLLPDRSSPVADARHAVSDEAGWNDDSPIGPEASGMASSPGADRARLFERFLEFLGRLAGRTSILAVIEDVQWLDPATRDLLTFLVRNVTSERIVAILTCRTDDLPASHPIAAWLAELGRLPGASRLELGRLDRAAVARLVEAIAGGPTDPAVIERVARRSDGHPLFAEELLAADATDAPPPSLVDILLARVLTLDAATLAVVRSAAVAGRPLDERFLAQIVARSEAEVSEALRVATARGVLVAHADGTHGFRHDLLREVVERELSAGERRALHDRIASTLESGLADDGGRAADATAELARHWFAADRPSKAFRSALAAAAAAEQVDAFAETHRLLERAITLEPRLAPAERPTRDDRIAARQRAATAADLAGDVTRAIELIRDAIGLTDDATNPTTVGLLHARLGFLTWASGRGEAALAEHERAVALVPADPPTSERANVLGGLAGALMGLGRFAASRPLAQAAIDCAVAAGAPAEECRGRMTLGSDLVALGEIDAGLEELRRAHDLARADRTELLVVTGHNLALNLLAADRVGDALDVALQTRQAARDGGLERRYGLDLAALEADVRFRLGQWSDADASSRAGHLLDPRGRGSPYLEIVRGRLAANKGDLGEARERLEGVSIAELDPDVAVIHAVASVETTLLAGDLSGAADLAAGSLSAFAGTGTEIWAIPLLAHGLRALADLAETARAARDPESERELLAAAEDLARHEDQFTRSAVGAVPTMRAWLATARAERTRVAGTADPAAWSAAVDAWAGAGAGFGAAYARFRLAETELRRTGVKAEVTPAVQAAWRTAMELEAEPLREQIETLARRARIVLAREPMDAPNAGADVRPRESGAAEATRAAPDHRLSAREIEVLRLVAAGRTNGEIGDELFITRKTAGVHVTHILDKLGVSNRVEAAMAAARLGLLDDVVAGADRSEAADRSTPRGA